MTKDTARQDLLKEARELCEAATKGPWETITYYVHDPETGEICKVAEIDGPEEMSYEVFDENMRKVFTPADAKLIARSRELVSELADFLEAVVNLSDEQHKEIIKLTLRAEKAEAEVERLKAYLRGSDNVIDVANVLLNGVADDTLKWKARAEEAEGKVKALESAIKRKPLIKCDFCLHNKPENTCQAYECDSWEFDYEHD